MKLKFLALCGALVAGLGGSAAIAHHSNAMFDRTKTVEIKGTVREFQWTNPHIWIELDIPGPQGVTPFSIEGPTPGVLRTKGWKFNSLMPGDQISVRMHPLKDGRKGGGLVSVTKGTLTLNYEPPPAISGTPQ
jgi:hypothetical protein